MILNVDRRYFFCEIILAFLSVAAQYVVSQRQKMLATYKSFPNMKKYSIPLIALVLLQLSCIVLEC